MIRGILCLLLTTIICIVEGRKVAVNDDVMLQRRLKLINKHPIKSFQLDSAIYDCIDIYKQPALDHPLLKNHKIQLEPSPMPAEHVPKTPPGLSRFGLPSSCPDGTVPIRRTSKEDLIREQSVGDIKDYYFYPNTTRDDAVIQFASLHVEKRKDTHFFAVDAAIDVRQPQTNAGESSGAQMWLFNAPDYQKVTNGISVGWLVDPQFYGDSKTHFTTSWVGEGGAGCFNIRCPGFVQVDPSTPLGFTIPDISNSTIYIDMPLRIYLDRETRNWWLMANVGKIKIGYWPKELFSVLNGGADYFHLGGFVRSVPNQLSPPMGSGIWNACSVGSALFSHITYRLYNDDVPYEPPPSDEWTSVFANCPNYRVLSCGRVRNRGYTFVYGGPRGSCS